MRQSSGVGLPPSAFAPPGHLPRGGGQPQGSYHQLPQDSYHQLPQYFSVPQTLQPLRPGVTTSFGLLPSSSNPPLSRQYQVLGQQQTVPPGYTFVPLNQIVPHLIPPGSIMVYSSPSSTSLSQHIPLRPGPPPARAEFSGPLTQAPLQLPRPLKHQLSGPPLARAEFSGLLTEEPAQIPAPPPATADFSAALTEERVQIPTPPPLVTEGSLSPTATASSPGLTASPLAGSQASLSPINIGELRDFIQALPEDLEDEGSPLEGSPFLQQAFSSFSQGSFSTTPTSQVQPFRSAWSKSPSQASPPAALSSFSFYSSPRGNMEPTSCTNGYPVTVVVTIDEENFLPVKRTAIVAKLERVVDCNFFSECNLLVNQEGKDLLIGLHDDTTYNAVRDAIQQGQVMLEVKGKYFPKDEYGITGPKEVIGLVHCAHDELGWVKII